VETVVTDIVTLASLAGVQLWVGWRHEKRDGRLTKIPYDPIRGACAKSDDPTTWSTREQAEWWNVKEHGNGVGIMFAPIESASLAGIDLDACRTLDTGQIEAWAQEIIDRYATYTEVSPSGTGLKLFFRIATADRAAIDALFAGQNGRLFTRSGGDHPPAIEVHRSRRYFAVTDESVGLDNNLRLVSVDDLRWLITEVGPRFAGEAKGESKSKGQDGSRSAKAFRLGAALKTAGATYEEMRDALLTDADPEIDAWARSKGSANNEREMRRIFDNAGDNEPAVRLEDFVAYMQSHDYVFMPAGDFWPASRVNARLPPVMLFGKNGLPLLDLKTGIQKEVAASDWLAEHAPVEQMTWCPGMPQLIRHRLISDGGWTDRKNVTVLNLYRPPRAQLGDATKAEPWIAHVRRIYPAEADHIIAFLAHRVQRPHEKINHGLLLGGRQGIGKDTLLEPVKFAVGPWNFVEASPQQMLGRFNGFVKAVVLRISEAKDMGEVDRFKFYDHMKAYLAAPPDVLRVDEKNLREHSVFNVCGVVLTTNHKVDGIYLPPDDRRHFVAWSDCTKGDFDEAYWNNLWSWYEREGFGHVAAYLTQLDLSGFNSKAPPPQTPAFWAIVDANRAPEDAELADVLDELKKPDAVTLAALIQQATGEVHDWLADRRNRRTVPHRLEKCGYVPVRNDAADDGLFKIKGRRQVIYASDRLTLGDRLRAVRAFTK
jgi:Family of unknown function (DUF5906)